MIPLAVGTTTDRCAADVLVGALDALTAPVRDPRLLWDELAGAGVPALLVPRRHGGLGFGLTEAVTLAGGLGERGPTLPFTASAVLATLVLVAVDPVDAGAVLTELATGDRVLGVRLTGGDAGSQLVVDHSTCSSWLHLQPVRGGAQVTLLGPTGSEPLGQVREQDLCRVLDDTSVVAVAETLAPWRGTVPGELVVDLVQAAAQAADSCSAGRARAARSVREATRALLPAAASRLPTELLLGGWAA